ncbi:MAG: multidrug transporter AcrB [Elusimicrobia bacterium CG08_land_8_20_14_0_20_51_18]|nr:MAG: multidrug transporter AcrB [Elusimicrobia bacterium CG08_land_8_20_14_0_20_51_18]
MNQDENNYGYAGRTAAAFISSKLTPILIISAVLLGVFSTLKLPREEEPQINVPMFDVIMPYPGAEPREIEKNIVEVGERKLWEIPGVEYVYSMAHPNMAMFILRFEVGTDPEEAANRVYSKIFSNRDFIPQGAGEPLVKMRSIDDVPVLALTLSGKGRDGYDLRRIASRIQTEINSVNNVSETAIIGGHKRQFIIHFDPSKMAEKRVTPLMLAGIIKMSNSSLPAGHYNAGPEKVSVETDAFIKDSADLKNIIVGISNGAVVRLSDIAGVSDGPDEEERAALTRKTGETEYSPAVTLSVAKKRGANATFVAEEVLERVSKMKGLEIPAGVEVEVTRNYGETAKEKSDELIYHMLLATLSVTILIALTLGWREAIVVLVAIPVTLALTMLVYYLYGYTLNRITLFALIFSIGILVDDAIVVVENINRHCLLRKGNSLFRNVLNAVDEVGNPTILATFTVIASILPMAFVSGMMGPYMRPIPIGASFAMLFSLGVAFIVTPWLFAKIVEKWRVDHCEKISEGWMDRTYRKFMELLIHRPKYGVWFLAFSGLLLAGALSMVFFKSVIFKTLPFDNKNEFQVVINMPESSSLENTLKAAREMGDYLSSVGEVENTQIYAGASAPYNFNGLVRHYFMRNLPCQADIQVNLKNKKDRKRQSHEIAVAVRPGLKEIGDRYGARLQVAEVPPGPPVLSTLVIEVFDKDPAAQLALAGEIKELLKKTPGIVDVDSYIPAPAPKEKIKVDRRKATLNGISPAEITQTVSMALNGYNADIAHSDYEHEPVDIRLRLSAENRKNLNFLDRIKLFSPNGNGIPLSAFVKKDKGLETAPIYRKNLQRVLYVTADIAGGEESPVYAVLNLQKKVGELGRKRGIEIEQYFTRQPVSSGETAVKWDGEWHITYEVFRDLGIAFLAVLVLIYILIVAWFEDFVTPLIIMSAIPLALIGIIPAHWGMNAFFTATSMIGFIASAGIVVRNSIILVDFIKLKLREGMSLRDAVIDAGVVRFRPMLLTALAVIVGAGVILFDPIFQGLAISLISGQIASTLLSRIAVPVLYYLVFRKEQEKPKIKIGKIREKGDDSDFVGE